MVNTMLYKDWLNGLANEINASTRHNKDIAYDKYKAAIDVILQGAATRGEYFYTYSGLKEDVALRLAKEYDKEGFLVSARKDRYTEDWSLYLNWS